MTFDWLANWLVAVTVEWIVIELHRVGSSILLEAERIVADVPAIRTDRRDAHAREGSPRRLAEKMKTKLLSMPTVDQANGTG
jgi:hypothetical protein